MSINKTFLTITLSIISIAPISMAAPAPWCGYVATHQNCYANTVPSTSCLYAVVNTSELQCLKAASTDVLNNPTNQTAIDNYTNLSYYFTGSYDIYGIRKSVVPQTTRVSSSTNVNVFGACFDLSNGKTSSDQVCKDANTAADNPYFVVPTAPPLPKPAATQTAAQCYAAADQVYKTSAVYLLLKAAMPKATPADASGCAGTTDQAKCSTTVQNVCQGQKKTQLIHCTEPTMKSMVIGCQ